MKLNEKFNVKPAKLKSLIEKIKALRIDLDDIEERFSRGSGKGGQKINKTSNRVELYHRPTGIRVVSQRERQRNINRFVALREMVERIEEKMKPPLAERRAIKPKKVARSGKASKRRALDGIDWFGEEGEE